MSHFYGSIQGNRGEATRAGSKQSGYRAYAASWQGRIEVTLYHDEDKGIDMARVRLAPHHGAGSYRDLYDGPVSGEGA